MAWIFSLSMECGDDAAAAAELTAHFESFSLEGESGESISIRGQTLLDDEGATWVMAIPQGVSRVGIQSDADARSMTLLGSQLYDRLRIAPRGYRFALCGIEVDGFRTCAELLDADAIRRFRGLVVEEAIFKAVGEPPAFEPFAPGYWWLPYGGETYPPR
ncbi:MAG: hypothetical protein JXR96_02165 [Deltaproteobacteria bacterium]|nr:hypothetical protein [Deltaproteobacteria bacterium]